MSENSPEINDGTGTATPFTQDDVDELVARVEAAEARAAAAETAASDAPGKSIKYAVYDRTYLRFVGDAQTTRKDAVKLAKDRDVTKYEIREV